MGPSELISKSYLFQSTIGLRWYKCDVLKTCFDKVEGDVGMFDDNIVDEGDPDQKKSKIRDN
jgi:hypothetical protein